MTQDRLKILFTESRQNHSQQVLRKNSRIQEIQAEMERFWLENPAQFDPERDCIQRKRIDITFKAIMQAASLDGKRSADLGCGFGMLTHMIRDSGALVDAVDIASMALEKLKMKNMERIRAIQECLPTLSLKDDFYDLVVCTEVIGFLKPQEYRMLMAELSRLVKKEGHVVCSTAFDIDSKEAFERFVSLAETEFIIDTWILSYHYLLIKFRNFFEAPLHFTKGSKDPVFRQSELIKRKKFNWFWFKLNSTKGLASFWKGVCFFFSPIVKCLQQNSRLMDALESVAKFLWESRITHAIFIGKRRPLSFPLPPDQTPQEPKHKRQIWE